MKKYIEISCFIMICLVLFPSLSYAAGTCTTCGSPLVNISDNDVEWGCIYRNLPNHADIALSGIYCDFCGAQKDSNLVCPNRNDGNHVEVTYGTGYSNRSNCIYCGKSILGPDRKIIECDCIISKAAKNGTSFTEPTEGTCETCGQPMVSGKCEYSKYHSQITANGIHCTVCGTVQINSDNRLICPNYDHHSQGVKCCGFCGKALTGYVNGVLTTISVKCDCPASLGVSSTAELVTKNNEMTAETKVEFSDDLESFDISKIPNPSGFVNNTNNIAAEKMDDSLEKSGVLTTVYALLVKIGFAISLLVIAAYGVLWISASPTKKADLKQAIMPILVGLFILLTGTTFVIPIVKFITTML